MPMLKNRGKTRLIAHSQMKIKGLVNPGTMTKRDLEQMTIDSKRRLNFDIEGIIKNPNADVKKHALDYHNRAVVGSSMVLGPQTTKNRNKNTSLLTIDAGHSTSVHASANLGAMGLSNLLNTPSGLKNNLFTNPPSGQ